VSASVDELTTGDASHVNVFRCRAGERTWWFGGGSEYTEEPIADFPPYSGELRLAAWEGTIPFRLELHVHLRTDDGEEDRWLAGEIALRAEAGERKMFLAPCAPIDEPPFVLGEPPAGIAPPSGPSLATSVRGAILPGVGIFDPDASELVSERGRTRLKRVVPQGSYPDPFYGAASGLLAFGAGFPVPDIHHELWFADASGKTQTAGRITLVTGAFDERGERFAAVIFRDGLRFAIFDPRRARLLAETALPRDEVRDDYAIDVGWRGAEAYAYSDGLVTFVDERGASRSEPAPAAIGIGGRHYGAANPSYEPTLRRTAWMVSVEEGARAIVGWADGDGESGGQVLIPDGGWARNGFGETAVLRDGRIVAIGTRVWLVDPRTSGVANFGVAGSYPSPLPITYAPDGKPRLWSRGNGPWWIDLG
jgi:hypothetical protein